MVGELQAYNITTSPRAGHHAISVGLISDGKCSLGAVPALMALPGNFITHNID